MGDRKVSFFYHKGSESLSMWFGQTEVNLRNLFDRAKKSKPSIIFFDEIDGIAPNRTEIIQPARAAIVACLLGLIDSLNRGDVLIIAATNRVDSVDPALLRPGRFDKRLEFSLPDESSRERILRVNTQRWKRCRPDAELLKFVATSTVGFTGADLAKLAHDAIYCAAARCKTEKVVPVQVKKVDWTKAISQMSHSPTNVFGSSLVVHQPLPENLNPLVGPTIKEIIDFMKPYLPSDDCDESKNRKNNIGEANT